MKMEIDIFKKHHMFRWLLSGLFYVVAMFSSHVAFAEKPPTYSQIKHERHDSNRHHDGRYDDGKRDRSRVNISLHFGDQQRIIVHDYYYRDYQSGFCPPGLAKKRNGCMPPGLAKKWRRGYPLPRDVIFHNLPPRLVIQLGVAPAGHRYVRVAADILLIAVGTGIVIDAIEDLGKM
jgi:Ni/Co efflux regulator RcnB